MYLVVGLSVKKSVVLLCYPISYSLDTVSSGQSEQLSVDFCVVYVEYDK